MVTLASRARRVHLRQHKATVLGDVASGNKEYDAQRKANGRRLHGVPLSGMLCVNFGEQNETNRTLSGTSHPGA